MHSLFQFLKGFCSIYLIFSPCTSDLILQGDVTHRSGPLPGSKGNMLHNPFASSFVSFQ